MEWKARAEAAERALDALKGGGTGKGAGDGANGGGAANSSGGAANGGGSLHKPPAPVRLTKTGCIMPEPDPPAFYAATDDPGSGSRHKAAWVAILNKKVSAEAAAAPVTERPRPERPAVA